MCVSRQQLHLELVELLLVQQDDPDRCEQVHWEEGED